MKMTPEEKQAKKQFKIWTKSRPKNIQKIIKRFPPGMRFNLDGNDHYVIGYNDDYLIVSPVHPSEDYDLAIKHERYIHLECLVSKKRPFLDNIKDFFKRMKGDV